MREKKKSRYFAPEFKKEIVEKILRGEMTVAEVGTLHQIGPTMISRWKKEMREGELDSAVEKAPRVSQMGVDPRYVRELEQKLREANEKLGELYVVVEGLKKVRNGLGFTKNVSSFIVSGGSSAPLKRRVG